MSALLGVTTPRTIFDQELEERLEDGDDDVGSGWFCLRTAPFPCPAEGCDFVAEFATAFHRIIVWPRRDDPALLEIAHDMKKLGRQPQAVEYEKAFGRCLTFDAWKRLGAPGHGFLPRPAETPFQRL